MFTKKNILLFFSVVGILISSYLAYTKLTSSSIQCGSHGGCNAVQNSDYSTLFGIPLGVFGMGYYFVLFFVFFTEDIKNIAKIRSLLVAWGLLFSTYLTYLEAFVIHAYCLWCVGSFVNIILIALIHFLWKQKQPST